MTKTRFYILILAVMTALILAGCGASDDSLVDSSVPEALQTFGVQVDPSAQPSSGQVMPQISAGADSNGSDVTTIVGGNVTVTESQPAVSDTTPTTSAPSTTKSPSSSGGASSTATPSASPSTSPNIAPPAPASSATVEDVMQYVGKTPSQLIEDLGYPTSSSYEYVDEDDPSQGEIGTMYYADFTVTTLRNDSGEIITAVTPRTDDDTDEASDGDTSEDEADGHTQG